MNTQSKEKTIIKKSELNAESLFDYKKIMYPKERFLPCDIEENDEELIITYNFNKLKNFESIKQERTEVRFVLLMDIFHLLELKNEYYFTIRPDNLYYDRNYRLYIMNRDIYKRGESFKEEELIMEMKSLIGFSLQKRYSYEHYFNGGAELLKKDKFLSKIYSIQDREGLSSCLEEEYENVLAKIKKNKIEVNKMKFKTIKRFAVIGTLLLVLRAGFNVFYYISKVAPSTAVMKADQFYIENDSVGIIDTLSPLSIDQLDRQHKYILAQSYIKSENLTMEQKENVLAKLSVKSEEKQMEYWIYLGRLNVSEAENIAMQFSDDELLLYAYLKEKSLVETDSTITGEEKTKKLADLEGKISKLAEKYNEE